MADDLIASAVTEPSDPDSMPELRRFELPEDDSLNSPQLPKKGTHNGSGLHANSAGPFFDLVSRTMQGKQAEIEVTSLKLGGQTEAEWLPMYGLTYDPADDVVEVALESLDHLIPSPREIYVDDGGEVLSSLEIVDADGNKQILKLRDELMLPAPRA